eukprot:360255-Chlamydomonas_euryale.AAC.17
MPLPRHTQTRVASSWQVLLRSRRSRPAPISEQPEPRLLWLVTSGRTRELPGRCGGGGKRGRHGGHG